jgi:hypothetical protein
MKFTTDALLAGEMNILRRLHKGEPKEFSFTPSGDFQFPITRLKDVTDCIKCKSVFLFDAADDVFEAVMRYSYSTDETVLIYEMNDMELGEIEIRLPDDEMKDLIFDAGFADIENGSLIIEFGDGVDFSTGEPISRTKAINVCDWVDCDAYDKETIESLLVTYILKNGCDVLHQNDEISEPEIQPA